MSFDPIALDQPFLWYLLGSALILLELVVPGLVSVFLGLAALTVGACLQLLWVTSTQEAFVLFILTSTLLLLVVRTLIARFLPSVQFRTETDETKLSLHQKVKVTDSISAQEEGRVQVRGTSWKARFPAGSTDSALPGTEVYIVGQDNLTYIVSTTPLPNSSQEPK